MRRGWTSVGGVVITLLMLAAAGVYLLRGYLTPFLPVPAGAGLVGQIQLPAGFHIHLYADGLPGARSLALSPAGVLFVGTRDAGRVYAVEDTDADFRGDRVHVLASGLDQPNGVAFHAGRQARGAAPAVAISQ